MDLERLSALLRKLLMIAGGVALLALTLLATMNVALRIFQAPEYGTYVIVSFLGAIITAGALGYTQKRKDHIVVDIALVTSVDAAFSMVGTEMWNIFSNYGLTVIPLFILVGEIVHYAGYNFSLYDATYKWFGHYRGGLAMTTILASAAFSAISGSNTATAATMSAVAIPAMKEYKYHPLMNAGSVAAGATLGVLIPPSIVLVVYGL